MLDLYPRDPTFFRPADAEHQCLTRCAACGDFCLRERDALVGFCDECLEGSDPKTFVGYPDGWVMLGGGD